MIPDFSGDFISAKNVHDGDIVEIVDEGRVEFNEALGKDMFNLKVKLNGNEKLKTWSPSNKHGTLLQSAFGLDSITWKGKKVQLIIIEDKMLIKPIVEQKVN